MSVGNLNTRYPEIASAIDGWYQRLFGLLLALGLWIGIASFFPNQLMPYPLETLQEMVALISSGVAWPHLRATFTRMVLSFFIAMTVGTMVGIAMGTNHYANKFFTPYVVVGLAVPSIAWAAIGFLVFGFSIFAPVTAAVAITTPYIIVNVWKGVENIDTDLLKTSDAFDVSRGRLLRRMIVPSIAPSLFAAARYGLAVSWKIITIAEMFASSSGVGYKLVQSYQLYRFEEAFGWAALFMVLILAIEYAGFKPLERRVFEFRDEVEIQK